MRLRLRIANHERCIENISVIGIVLIRPSSGMTNAVFVDYQKLAAHVQPSARDVVETAEKKDCISIMTTKTVRFVVGSV